MEPLKDGRWKRSKLNRGEGSVVWHRAMGRANRSTERPFVPGSSFLLRKPPPSFLPPLHRDTSNASRIHSSRNHISDLNHLNTFPDGNALSKSVKSCADFVSPKFSRGQWEYFAATRSLIGLAFNPNFHFRSLNTRLGKVGSTPPFSSLPCLLDARATVFGGERALCRDLRKLLRGGRRTSRAK